MIFIRPWFLLLIVIPFLLWFFKKGLTPTNHLTQFVDKRLLPFVSVRFLAQTERKTAKGLGIIWLAFVLAGSGPAFQHVDAPAVVSAPGTVIVMDLSPAMNGANLDQAKLKIYDLLNDLKGNQVGLVLYDQKGYVASPLTQDIGIVRTMIHALAPDALPLGGNEPEKGFLKADELFRNAGATDGQIIFITAGGFDETALVELSKRLPYKVSILGIGSPEGSPILSDEGDFMRHSDGTPILARLNPEELSKVGLYVPASTDTTDVWQIVSQSQSHSEAKKAADNTVLVWQDLGPYILLCIVPFFLFLFRRGVLFLFVLGLSFSAQAGLFLRPDQEAYFEQKKAVLAYRAGDYEAAKIQFSHGYTADDAYNEGNAKAYLGDIQGAIASYKKALGLNPLHEEAKYNKEYLEKQMPPDSSQNNQGNSENQPQSNKSDSQEQSDNEQQTNPSDAQQKSSEDSDESSQNPDEQKSSKAAEENSSNSNSQKSDLNPNNMGHDSKNSPEIQQNDSDENSSEQSGQSDASLGQVPQSDTSLTQTEQSDASSEQTKDLTPDNKKSEAQKTMPKFDQESQQLFNRVQHDPSRLLRYRLYQQAHKEDGTYSEEIIEGENIE